MNCIDVECPDLIEAFEPNNSGLIYFLSMESGEVIKVAEDFCPDETISGIDYFSDPRYIRVPKISDTEYLCIRKEYLAYIHDEDLRDKLEQALLGRGSLKRFIDILRAYPEYYMCWTRFKNLALLKLIKVWSGNLEIEINLINTPIIIEKGKVL